MGHYYETLLELHQVVRPNTYVEIGVSEGGSLRRVSPETLCIGIDPRPSLDSGFDRDNVRIYPMTSDEFFASYSLDVELEHRPLDLAFIDGMHLFEYVLRDFTNLESASCDDTVILLHDCMPSDATMSARTPSFGAWTGDVWKMLPCLLEYRPELRYSIVGEDLSTLLVISGLDNTNAILSVAESEIVDRFLPLEYKYFENEVLAKSQSLHAELGESLDIHFRRPSKG